MKERCLPFPRGSTYNQLAALTMTATLGAEWEGREFDVEDTEHGTGVTVVLRIVRNTTGGSITPANQLFTFDGDAKDFGRQVDAVTNTIGDLCVPIDDVYGAIPVIAENDLFYVVMRGPCKIMSGTSSMAVNARDAVTSDAVGALEINLAAAGEFVIGTADAAITEEDVASLIWVDIDLRKAPGHAGD